MTGSITPKKLVFEDFEPLKGKVFVAECEPAPLTITLADAQLLRQGRGFRVDADRPPFVLIFHTAPEVLLAPAIYEMTAEGFGPEPIYLEQTSPPESGALDGFYYQAVFN